MTLKHFLFVLLVAGCSSSSSTAPRPSNVMISVIEPTGILTGIVNTEVGQFAARVRDSVTGQFLSGITVNWSISQGAGSLPAPTTTTDSIGVATNTMTLDTHPGPAEITASLSNGKAVRFTVAAVHGPIATVQSAVGQLPGVPGGIDTIAVTVADQYGNPVPQALVHFLTTDGVVRDTVANTDGSGRAFTQWFLPVRTGINVTATAIVVPLAPVNFTTTLAP